MPNAINTLRSASRFTERGTSHFAGLHRRAAVVFAFSVVVLLTSQTADSQVVSPADSAALSWFQDAKLGIFIHWGYYAVNGIAESWSIYNKRISHGDYMKQAEGFTGERYDPAAWAKLFSEAGAKYAVMTSKHHDGVALWKTKYSHLNVVEKTPAGRDLIAPYCSALRNEGLKVGLYFSLCDWSHPDYEVPFSRANAPDSQYHTKDYPRSGQEGLKPWDRFLRFAHGQIEELQRRYNPDLFWFDGDWEHKAEEWDAKGIRDSLKHRNPSVVINSRLQGYGDYRTPEQDPPVKRIDGPWELCMTINSSWGYQQRDTAFKSSREIIRTFVECLGGGGNLLLDVGPKADGTIPSEEVDRLKDLGRWTRLHAEAVYGTIAGLPQGYFYGPTALSRDRRTLFLYLFDRPNEFVAVKGIKNAIKTIRVIGRSETLGWFVRDDAPWNEIPGIVYITVPETVTDEYATVLAVELDGALQLFVEK